MTDLSGPWALADETGTYGCEIRLPGEDGITALHRAGLIPEPYWGRNEYALRWICERDWTARRTFQHDGSAAFLVMSEVDTIADVRINGKMVWPMRSAFERHRVPVGNALRVGDNEIEVTFRSPVREGATIAKALPFPVPQTENCPIPYGNLIRKPHCDFGWDWNIALAPFGIYGEIRLESDPQIRSVQVRQAHSAARVEVEVSFWWGSDDRADAAISLAGQSQVVPIEPGYETFATFTIEHPDLWWPAGQGAQVLYDLTIRVGDVVESRQIGLRSIELVSKPDAAGRSFGFRVNGRDVFAKGANWIPADALNGRITRDAVRDLLESAVAANMNMIRVWGGGRYEPDWFYDMCDELGLLVWQDFMFACSLYPSTEEFLARVDAEVRQQVRRLQHHASIALWCGDNELVGALTWYPESRENRDRYLVSYDRLNRQIEQSLRSVDPDANWWPSSPSPGPMSFGDAWHDDRSGDMHFWSVWHEGRDFEHYRDVSPRFCSEFGFQSYPSMEVIRTFAEPKDWNIASPVLESHQKNAGGNARIAETMFRYFRWPERFEDFVWLSQLQQALAIKTAVTHWRSLKPHCMGTLYWQLNDTWPVCSWSSLDYGGGWKLLHHFARDFYRPVTVVAVPDGDTLRLVGVNDGPEPVELSVAIYATAMDGTARPIGEGRALVGAAAVPLAAVATDALPSGEVVTFGWQASDGSKGGDIHAPLRWKAYDLPDPHVAMDVAEEDGRHVLSLSAQAMAFFLTAEADVPGRWDRNAVHLGPGHTTRLSFTPREAAARPRFALRHLQSATMARH